MRQCLLKQIDVDTAAYTTTWLPAEEVEKVINPKRAFTLKGEDQDTVWIIESIWGTAKLDGINTHRDWKASELDN